jgi:transketolase
MNADRIIQWKLDCIQAREFVIRAAHKSGAGHVGGSMSAIEIFRACLAVMKISPEDADTADNDWFVLSKGHGCLGWYAVLAQQGFIKEEELFTFEDLNSRLQGHIDRGHFYPFARVSTGSLGQGLSAGIGIRLSMIRKNHSGKVVVILGDGECQEGMVLEAAMFAGFQKLNGIVAIIDNNTMQLIGKTDGILSIKPTKEVWKSFGWEVMEIDGHEIQHVVNALRMGLEHKERPFLIIANTMKGHGISFMEGNPRWHHRAPDRQEASKALMELENAREKVVKGAK